MQFLDSIFGSLLKPIDRRRFRAIVEGCNGDAYDKTFKSWDHVVALVYAQLSGADSLRAIETGFNANSHHHYHLGVGSIARSTLSDANARRPVEVFAQTFTMLADKADRHTRHEGAEMVSLIDSSPIPLGKTCDWATWNGRIRGMKMHVVYDPNADCPRCVEITAATVNDVEIGREVEIERRVRPTFSTAAIITSAGGRRSTTPTPASDADQGEHAVSRHQAPLCAQNYRRRLQDRRRRRGGARQQGRFPAVDPAAAHSRQARQRRTDHSHHQRSRAHRGRNRSPLQGPLANRTAVPLDQAASSFANSSAPTKTRSACKSSPP